MTSKKVAPAAPLLLTQRVMPNQGADPELFLTMKGEPIGAERCIPQEGLPSRASVEESITDSYKRSGYPKETIPNYVRNYMSTWSAKPTVVLDGVQVELHPPPATCRQGLAANIASAIKTLDDHLTKHFKKEVQISFEPVVEISEKEYAVLTDQAKALGCQESKNIYDLHASIKVPKDYRIRSAGGHMHFGWDLLCTKKIDPRRFIKLCDVLVGNTCVLLDRHPLAKQRREVYGRAGEYRTPSYGVEYRTLSNFWLQHYVLTGFVFGMARIAATILYHTEFDPTHVFGVPPTTKWDAEKDLLGRVNIDAIRTAINENDRDLALANWLGVRSFIEDHIPAQTTGSYGMALGKNFLANFDLFLTKPVEEWIDLSDPVGHWTSKIASGVGNGWEIFINGGDSLALKKLVPLKKKGK